MSIAADIISGKTSAEEARKQFGWQTPEQAHGQSVEQTSRCKPVQ